jgi:hypothetical protein
MPARSRSLRTGWSIYHCCRRGCCALGIFHTGADVNVSVEKLQKWLDAKEDEHLEFKDTKANFHVGTLAKDGVTLASGSSFMKKKLIEVALPLEPINKASAREKSPSQRHRSAVTIAYFC